MVSSHQLLLLAIVGISIALMLVRPRGVPEVYWVSGGVVLLLVCKLIPLRLFGQGLRAGTDVYFFLIGMMLVSELARERGVFDWLAALAVRSAKKSSLRLFSAVYGIGTIVTILLSNDATAVVLTPCILSAVRKAKVDPLPHLFACALVANAASFVLPISNPANLVVFHDSLPPVLSWFAAFALASLLAIVATYAVLRWIFRRQLTAAITAELDAAPLTTDGKLVLAGIGLMVIVLLAASACKKDLGLPTCLSAVGLACVVAMKARCNPLRFAREISWRTLILVGGLFVMVDAVKSIGALDVTKNWLVHAARLAMPLQVFVVGSCVAIANNVLNNLPLGLLAGATLTAAQAKAALTQAVLVGIDLGPNLSVTGSLATILWLLAVRKEKIEIGFWQFFKVGVIAMPVALVLSLGSIILLLQFRN